MTTHSIRWLLAVVLLAPTPLLAQGTVADQRAWRCKFVDRSFADYKGPYRARDTVWVHIDNVNIAEKSARTVVGRGSNEIGVVAGDRFVTFFNLERDGNSGQSLTIHDPQMPDGRFEAMLSRRIQLLKDGPSRHGQEWGFCSTPDLPSF